MDATRLKSACCVLAIAGCLQFVVLTIIAMGTFPGGIVGGVEMTRYDFFQNFFSELGGTITASGKPNPVSSVLFFIALFVVGACTVPFLVVAPSAFKRRSVAGVFSLFGTFFGVISAAGFIGVAFTPWDLAPEGHILSVFVAFSTLIPLSICYCIAIASNKAKVLSWKYFFIMIEFAAASILYSLLLFGDFDMASNILIQAVGQKLIVYNAIIVISLLALGSWRVFKAPLAAPGAAAPT